MRMKNVDLSEPVTSLSNMADAPAPRGGTETILLVEDERAVRVLTRLVLERAGYRVIEAADGTAGLKAWHDCGGNIDLLLTDVVMPGGMSGRDLADQLLSMHPEIRVLFTSGYTGRELSLRARQSFLPKPAAPKEMLGAVRRSLDG